MSEAIKCDGCGEFIDTEYEHEQYLTVEVEAENFQNHGGFDQPIEDKKLHFHLNRSRNEDNQKNCIEENLSNDALARKIKE